MGRLSPYSWECSSAKVGDSVLVAWWGNSLSTARAWFKGSGKTAVTYASNTYTLPDGLIVEGGGNIAKAEVDASADIDAEYNSTMFHTTNATAGTFPSGSGSKYGAGITLPYRNAHGNTKPDYAGQIWIPSGDNAYFANDMFYRASIANSWNAWQRVMRTENYTMPVSSSVAITLTANKIYLISGGIGGSASSYVVWMGTSAANSRSSKILDFGGFDVAFTATGITVTNLRPYAMSIGVLMIS